MLSLIFLCKPGLEIGRIAIPTSKVLTLVNITVATLSPRRFQTMQALIIPLNVLLYLDT